jgi:5-methylcytosine-specific restriction endonuclease McrA
VFIRVTYRKIITKKIKNKTKQEKKQKKNNYLQGQEQLHHQKPTQQGSTQESQNLKAFCPSCK